MATNNGELITETLGFGRGRSVTVYVPPEPAESLVFAADGSWHVGDLSVALERSGASRR